MNNSDFKRRDIVRLVLPIKDVIPLRPEQVMIEFGEGGRTIDVGARCYLKRADAIVRRRVQRGGCLPVNLDSLDKGRCELIREFIILLSDEVDLSGKKKETLHRTFSNFIHFVDWCDSSFKTDVLQDQQDARIAFANYIEYFRNMVRQNIISINTAAKRQNHVMHFLSNLFQIDDIGRGIRLLRLSMRATESTTLPDEKMQGKMLDLCGKLFEGISFFVLKKKPYPFRLRMPNYLSWEDNILWIFPAVTWFMSPTDLKMRDLRKYPGWVWDYHNGRVCRKREIAHKYPNETRARKAVDSADSLIIDANADPRHFRRRNIAMFAHNMFVQLFLANTGMNWAQVKALPWGESYEVQAEDQGFRSIKYRAGGRKVVFTIQSGFIVFFKKYLELRDYLLDGEICDLLFFTRGVGLNAPPKEMGHGILKCSHDTLSHIDPSIERIFSKRWRAAKGDWALRNTDLKTASTLLQNSELTMRRYYSTGSVVSATEEFSGYFDRLAKVVRSVNRDTTLPNLVESPLGGCSGQGDPELAEDSVPISPDCKQPEGCLFCNKFAVHADELDLRKILSCRFVILATEHLSASKEHFDNLFGEVLHRIDFIVNKIRCLSTQHAELVSRVIHEIDDDGNLSEYWSGKLNMLINLGVIGS